MVSSIADPLASQEIISYDVELCEPDLCGAHPALLSARAQRLADINLIIVGQSPKAEDLLRRRCEAGGRALLLWSERTPITECLRRWYLSTEHARDDSNGEMVDDFVWHPPVHNKPWFHVDVQRLREQFASGARRGAKFGPDVVDLAEGELCEVVKDPDGTGSAVRVFDSEGAVVWQVTGLVVFADDGGDVDVEVADSNMMPFVIPSFRSAMAPLPWYLVNLCLYSFLMVRYEPFLHGGQLPWWRGLSMLMVLPFGLTLAWIWGPALTGMWPSRGIMVGCCIMISCVRFFADLFVFRFDGIWVTFSFFSSCVIATLLFLGITIPPYIWWAMLRVKGKVPWSRHLLWAGWIFAGSFGSWLVLYGVALIYLNVRQVSRGLAAIMLPTSTAAVELVLVALNNSVYRNVVFLSGITTGSVRMVGDQRQLADSVIQYTHGYKEATHLISLIAGEVADPGLFWLASVTLALVINVASRTYVAAFLQAKIVPERFLHFVKPTWSCHLFRQVRYVYGYPRFVPVIALALVRWIAFEGTVHPLFNGTCLTVLIVVLVLEVLEDVVVLLVTPPDLSSSFSCPDIDTESFDNVFCKDSVGTHGRRVSLPFHGARTHSVWQLAATLGPTSWFGFALTTLLLGAGYVHGACDNPIQPDSQQVLDGLLWTSPLRC